MKQYKKDKGGAVTNLLLKLFKKSNRKAEIRQSIINETRTNSPSGILRCIGGLNKVLLYLTALIFAGNIFIGAIADNILKVKAQSHLPADALEQSYWDSANVRFDINRIEKGYQDSDNIPDRVSIPILISSGSGYNSNGGKKFAFRLFVDDSNGYKIVSSDFSSGTGLSANQTIWNSYQAKQYSNQGICKGNNLEDLTRIYFVTPKDTNNVHTPVSSKYTYKIEYISDAELRLIDKNPPPSGKRRYKIEFFALVNCPGIFQGDIMNQVRSIAETTYEVPSAKPGDNTALLLQARKAYAKMVATTNELFAKRDDGATTGNESGLYYWNRRTSGTEIFYINVIRDVVPVLWKYFKAGAGTLGGGLTEEQKNQLRSDLDNDLQNGYVDPGLVPTEGGLKLMQNIVDTSTYLLKEEGLVNQLAAAYGGENNYFSNDIKMIKTGAKSVDDFNAADKERIINGPNFIPKYFFLPEKNIYIYTVETGAFEKNDGYNRTHDRDVLAQAMGNTAEFREEIEKKFKFATATAAENEAPPDDPLFQCKDKLFGGSGSIWNPASWFQDAICEMLNFIIFAITGTTDSINEQIEKVEKINYGLFIERAYAATPQLKDANFWVVKSWKVMLGLVNILTIIILLVIAFSNILRINIDTYTVKKSLPGLILGVILANFSLLIGRMMIDLAQILADTLKDKGGTILAFTSIAKGFTGSFAEIMGALGGLILSPVIIGMLLLGWFIIFLMIAARKIVVYLLIIIAPLAFICLALPFASGYFKKWWGIFTIWILMLPVVNSIFWVASKIGMASEKISIGNAIIVIALTYFAIMLPFTWGGAVTKLWGGLGTSFAGGLGLGALIGKKKGDIKEGGKQNTWLKLREMKGVGGIIAGLERFHGKTVLGPQKVLKGLREDEETAGERQIIWGRFYSTDGGVEKLIQKDTTGLGTILANSGQKNEGLIKFGNVDQRSLNESGELLGSDGKKLEDPDKIRKYFTAVDALEKRARNHPVQTVRDEANSILTRYNTQNIFSAQEMHKPSEEESKPEAPPVAGSEGIYPGVPMSLQRNNIRYGQYDNSPTIIDEQTGKEIKNPNYGEIQIDTDASREAWQEIEPGLAGLGEEQAKRKVTGFVHAHEAFHDIVANKAKGKVNQEEEEKLADAFARQSFGIGNEEDRKMLEKFESQLPEGALKFDTGKKDADGNPVKMSLMDAKYDVGENGDQNQSLLVGLHRAGLEYGKISKARLAQTAAAAETSGPGVEENVTIAAEENEAKKAMQVVRETERIETKETVKEGAPQYDSVLTPEQIGKVVEKLSVNRLMVKTLSFGEDAQRRQQYNKDSYESSLQDLEKAGDSLKNALSSSGISPEQTNEVIRTIETAPSGNLSGALNDKFNIDAAAQERLRPNINEYVEKNNLEKVKAARIAREEVELKMPVTNRVVGQLQSGEITLEGFNKMRTNTATAMQKLASEKVSDIELKDIQENIIGRIKPSASFELGRINQEQILSELKQLDAATSDLANNPKIVEMIKRKAPAIDIQKEIEIQAETKFRVNYAADKFNAQMKEAMSDVYRKYPGIPQDKINVAAQREVSDRIKVPINRVVEAVPDIRIAYGKLDHAQRIQADREIAARMAAEHKIKGGVNGARAVEIAQTVVRQVPVIQRVVVKPVAQVRPFTLPTPPSAAPPRVQRVVDAAAQRVQSIPERQAPKPTRSFGQSYPEQSAFAEPGKSHQ